MDVRPETALPPAVLAAQRTDTSGAARVKARKRAYPAVLSVEDQAAVTAQLSATRALLSAGTPQQVADIAMTLVHDLGGAVVPARLANMTCAVPIDVSLGLSEPLLPWADPMSLAAMRLATVLPDFLVDARLVLCRLQGDVRLEEEATRDVLTGLLARRAWMRRLAQAEAGDAVCLIDLDRFKSVNDGLGHAAGDEVLRSIKSLLDSNFRDVDSCGRYGGDELACLTRGLPGPALVERCEGTARQWEQVRPAVAATVTLSIGVAAVDERSGRMALQRADQAMYRAKAGGRIESCSPCSRTTTSGRRREGAGRRAGGLLPRRLRRRRPRGQRPGPRAARRGHANPRDHQRRSRSCAGAGRQAVGAGNMVGR